MHRAAAALLAVALALGGCAGGEAEVDIAEFAPEQPTLFSIPGSGPDSAILKFLVRTGDLRPVLDRRGAVDLRVFDCDAPDGPGETVPIYFGGEPLAGIAGHQLSDDPETDLLLSAAVPRRALDVARPCARLVRHPTLLGPEIISRPLPLPPL